MNAHNVVGTDALQMNIIIVQAVGRKWMVMEMRIIDGDALKRRCQKVATEAYKTKMVAKVETVMNQVIDFIKEAPTIQPDVPRVMALEELAAAQKTPVWRETKRAHKDLYNGWMLAYDIQRGQGITGTRQGMTEPNGRVEWCKLDDYGKTWRCWTSRPTDAQREAVKWDED